MNNNLKPLLCNNINCNNIKITNIINNSNFKIQYSNNPFIIQTPEFIKDIENNIIEKNDYYEFILNIKSLEKNKQESFINLLNDLDNYFINFIKNNKKKFIFNNLKIKYKSINRNNTLKLKLLKDDINNNILKIIKNNKIININELKHKCNIKLLLNINALWNNNSIFGIYIKPLLIDIRPYKLVLNKNNILISEDDNYARSITINNDIINNDIINKNKILMSTSNNLNSFDNLKKKNLDINNNFLSEKKIIINNKVNESVNNLDDMTSVNYNNMNSIPEYNNNNKSELPKLSELSETSS